MRPRPSAETAGPVEPSVRVFIPTTYNIQMTYFSICHHSFDFAALRVEARGELAPLLAREVRSVVGENLHAYVVLWVPITLSLV
jgi:hypothetical protein